MYNNQREDRIYIRKIGIGFIAKLSVCYSNEELELIASEFEAEANDLPSGDEHFQPLNLLAQICREYKE